MTSDTSESEFIFYTSCKNTDSKQPQYFFALCKYLGNRSLASYIFVSSRRLAITFEAPQPLYFTPEWDAWLFLWALNSGKGAASLTEKE